MKNCVLGKMTEKPDSVEIDVRRLIETRLLVQANSGGGKSWAIRRLLEQTCKSVQQIVIDCEGEFSTLRERHDYVICAPKGGDVIAHPRTAALLAQRLLETGVSAIIDIYELKSHERLAFVRLFLEALVNAPKALWHPVIIVLDEAHVFCPEHGKAESAGAVIDLATRGRKRGFCCVLATQRLSKLHKDAAAEMANKMIGRTGLDIDVKRAADELGMSGRVAVEELRNLEPGEFYVFGPALTKQVTSVKVGPVHTRHPKIGERMGALPPVASARIKKILAELSDLPQQAEEEMRTTIDLKNEIANLKRELTNAKKAQVPEVKPVAPKLKVLKIPFLKNSQVKALVQSIKTLKKPLGRCTDALTYLDRTLEEYQQSQQEKMDIKEGSVGYIPAGPTPSKVSVIGHALSDVKKGQAVKLAPAGPVHLKSPKQVKDFMDGGLKGPERKLLTVLAHYPHGRTRKQLAIMSGYSMNGGAFKNPLGALRSKGFVHPGDPVRITLQGQEALGPIPPLPTGQALIDHWMRELPGPAAKLLSALIERHPTAMTKQELASATGYDVDGGAFKNPLGRLRSLELVEGSSEIKVSDVLMGKE